MEGIEIEEIVKQIEIASGFKEYSGSSMWPPIKPGESPYNRFVCQVCGWEFSYRTLCCFETIDMSLAVHIETMNLHKASRCEYITPPTSPLCKMIGQQDWCAYSNCKDFHQSASMS